MPSIPPFDKESAKLVHFSHLLEHVSPSQAEPLPVSFVPPNAYWTSAEKAAFFQSLARCSRWRPDLISEELGGGKSVADVCSYIELLEQESREAHNTARPRITLPMAREVSEDWLLVEESMAEILQADEGRWHKSALKRKRRETIRSEKRSLRLGHAGDSQQSGGAAIAATSANAESDREEKTWRERLEKRKKDFARVWKREDLLSSLSEKYLKAMDFMVRTLEKDEDNKELEVSIAAQHNSPSNTVPSTAPVVSQPSPLATSSPPNAPNLNTLDNPQMDAPLITLDMPSPPRPRQPATIDPGPSRSHAHLQIPSSSPVNADSPPGALEHPQDLSPESRRRVRKRLWMRRKRALLSGLPASEVPTDPRKLKPGRKGKLKDKKENGSAKVAQARESASLDEKLDAQQDGDQSDAAEGSESQKTWKPLGCSKLESVAVDGLFLRTAGLDLFRFGNFGSLMSLMSDIFRLPDQIHDGETTAPTLSYHFLLLLRAHLVRFLSRLIGQIIVQKQVETQQKRRIRSSTHSDPALKIKQKNVREALGIVGYGTTRKEFFRRLKIQARDIAFTRDREASRINQGKAEGHVDATESDRSPSSDISRTSSVSDTDDTDVSDHQDDSCGDVDSASGCSLPRGFIPQSEFQLVWNPVADQGDRTLLPEDLDEEALLKELKAEDVVDSRDQIADRELEDLLWEEIGVQRNVLPEQTDLRAEFSVLMIGAREKGTKSRRFREPGGAIKSRVYINDSDEDEWEGPDQ